MYEGSSERLLIGFQDNFRTKATEGVYVPFNTNGLEGTQSINTPETKRGNLNPSKPYYDNLSVSGSITIPTDSISMWYWLKMMFGEPEITLVEAGVYRHTFKKKISSRGIPEKQPYTTIERQYADETTRFYNTYSGCKTSKFSMSLDGSGELTGSVDLAGANEEVGSESFHPSGGDPPIESDLSPFDKDAVKILGTDFETLLTTKFSLDVDFKTSSDKYIIGNRDMPAGTLAGIGEGVMDIGGSIGFVMENDVMFLKAINKETVALEIEIRTSDTEMLRILMPEVKMSRKTPQGEGNDMVSFEPDIKAFYSNATNNPAEAAIIFELINNQLYGNAAPTE